MPASGCMLEAGKHRTAWFWKADTLSPADTRKQSFMHLNKGSANSERLVNL